MKSLLEYITEDIPKRDKNIPKEDTPKRDKDTNKEDMPKMDKDTNKEDMPKMDKDTPKRDIINNENEVNENKANDFKCAMSSIGFRKINVYRF